MKTLSFDCDESVTRDSRFLFESREDAWVWDRIGDAYWRESRRDEARRAWERARRLTPGSARIKDKLTAVNTGGDPLS